MGGEGIHDTLAVLLVNGDRETARDIDRDERSTLTEEILTDTSRDFEDLLKPTASIDDLNALLGTAPSID
jgi:hypothetical protein